MVFRKKKKKKVTTYKDGKEVKEEAPAPEKIPPLEVPEPPAEEPEEEESEEGEDPEAEEIDYFEAGRDQGFIEGLSFAMATLRNAQNEMLRRRGGE